MKSWAKWGRLFAEEVSNSGSSASITLPRNVHCCDFVTVDNSWQELLFVRREIVN